MSLDGLQTFCPIDSDPYDNGSVPLEVLLDYRCESNAFDRIVPQTNANCQYDRFNRLRLRNNVTSAPSKAEHTHRGRQAHLQNDTVESSEWFYYIILTFLEIGLGASPCSSLYSIGKRSSFPVHLQHHHASRPVFRCRA